MPRDALDVLAQRIRYLAATDPQIAAAVPDPTVAEAISAPGLLLPHILRAVFDGYRDRPALGQRARELHADVSTGRSSVELLPELTAVTYGELSERVCAVAATLTQSAVLLPGDRVCMLGFTSVDYAVIDLALMAVGAVAVPLQTSAPVASLIPIVEETEPVVIACSVDAIQDGVDLAGVHPAAMLLVFDVDERHDDHRDALALARQRLADAGGRTALLTLQSVIADGIGKPLPGEANDDREAPGLLLYTSGSTGSPKGAVYTERLLAGIWQGAAKVPVPSIILSFMPMSHMLGRGTMYMTLAAGGTAYFAAKSDLSTFLDDLALVRPTQLHFVPRIWDMLFHEYASRLARHGGDGETAEADVREELRQDVLGGRYIAALTASAPISPELRAWVESVLEMKLREAYGSTEVRGILINGQIQRPPVIDYKLVDVPGLGYFSSDRPHPRGELLVKSADAVKGYYKRPELTAEMFDADGWYHTGDIVAEISPDRLALLDRSNNVLKLSQGEFVTVSKLETVFGDSPLVRQIYVYANSSRAYLVAVVVPTEDALAAHGVDELKSLIAESLQDAARKAALQSYEIPRDFIVETSPFTLENGLLTGIRKLAWPKLKERYGSELEALYARLADGQDDELRALRRDGATRSTLETIGRAAVALLGTAAADVAPDAHFTDLGGDSLSALTFANLLTDIYGVDVPVGVIVSPATDLAGLADYVDLQHESGSPRTSFASVHGADAAVVHAGDLTLGAFLDDELLGNADALPAPSGEVRTVLLTGATGFLGRYLALEWLRRMDLVGGKVVCLVRAKDDATALERLTDTFDSGDAELLRSFRELAADHLEVLAGDKGMSHLGVDDATWQRLADTVDLIVDPAALVNHVLPYSQLFEPNVVGTAELIRLALTARLKPYTFVSTVAVGMQIEPEAFLEDADIRQISPSRAINDGYANGYGNSKWAGEVLLREAHERFGLPVAVFRSNMILAEPTHSGQLNVPDIFTRLIMSVVATGIAPASFYELDRDGQPQPAHYDGLPVDFIAESIAELGVRNGNAFRIFHVMNPHEDGIGLDQYVDWLIQDGIAIHRIEDHQEWQTRFETALRGLPERQRQASLLPLMLAFRAPMPPMPGAIGSAVEFRTAVQDAKIGPDADIPHVTRDVIAKYVADLKLLGLL